MKSNAHSLLQKLAIESCRIKHISYPENLTLPIKIEVKCKATGDNYQSAAQKHYQQQVEAAGGLYYIARDFQSFYDWYFQTFEKGVNHDK